MPERFDAIVIGAGLAGLSAAHTMSRQGMSVIVLERSVSPGSKNVMGGVLFRQPTAEVFPEFWLNSPLERIIVEHNLWVIAGESLVKAGHRASAWAKTPYHGFSILRGDFDAWLGEQVVGNGALIVPGANVQDLLRDGRGQVIGARVNRPEGDLLADIVILADGANSLLAERMGLFPRRKTDSLALVVQEVLLPPGGAIERARDIEQRFGTLPGQGVSIEIFGSLTKTMLGKAFLYTNSDSITFGIGALISELVAGKEDPYTLLQSAKAHPLLAPLLADCAPHEYSAHLMPDGCSEMPPLYGPGVLLAGDAAGLSNGIHRDSANLAVISGQMAGETALAAHAKGDFSRQFLAAYEGKLRQTAAYKDMHKYRKVTNYLLKHRQFFTRYPEALNALATAYLTVDNVPKRRQLTNVWKIAGGKLRLAFDLRGLLK